MLQELTQPHAIVGRKNEIARLSEIMDLTERARQTSYPPHPRSTPIASPDRGMDLVRHTQCAFLFGKAGIGKSRLAEEAAREASHRKWTVVWSSAQQHSTFHALWSQILRRLIDQGVWNRQMKQENPSMYTPLNQLLPQPQDKEPAVPPEQDRLRLWESFHTLLSTICQKTTLLFVLEDVQWADESSCHLLAHLVRRFRGRPVMFLCTCREEHLAPDHPLRAMTVHMLRERAIELLPISPLSQEHIGQMLACLPAQLVEHINTQVNGNPLFAQELARTTTINDCTPSFSSLPQTITTIFDSYVSRLSEPCLRLVEGAARLGNAFSFEAIHAYMSERVPTNEDLILDWLEEAIRAGVLLERVHATTIAFTFWNPLLFAYLRDHFPLQ